MIVYISDPPPKSVRELLQLINTSNLGYQINSKKKKSLALFYTNNKGAEKKSRETTSFTIATNNIKYLGVTLSKPVKDLCDKNIKSLNKRRIEDDIR
jgi:hypothetical protein